MGRGSGSVFTRFYMAQYTARVSKHHGAQTFGGARRARDFGIFFCDLMILNLQGATRAVRRVTKETGGGCTLAPMSQS